ncbi:MAG: ABC transporter ATP-binding protein, partial [Myxococcota bacterium]
GVGSDLATERSVDHALQTHALRRSFGPRSVIRDLELAVPRGTIYGLLGRNGAGKTTTIRMLLGVLAPDSGTLTLGDEEVRRVTPRHRRDIGYVSQQQHFYPWMRVRRLGRFVGGFYPRWDAAYFAELLGQLGIEPKQRVGELSGGTKMKLALALALAHRPPLLLLDEPTAGVDPVTRREIVDHLRDLVDREGRTVLFSTHNVSEIEMIGDQVGVLHGGRIFWQGPVDGLPDRVRRFTGDVPTGVEVLHSSAEGGLGWAEPAVWSARPDAERVSLEAAFVAIARQSA